ncbi:Protein kinase domain-containing protein [Trichoderma simmonsii]|uniref:Protein kinase domain-containing protein n=1 Tax=Trichoderma simmonsii TaxID=1491479 RepID=A0A8G0LBV9_9HYPO|nr:Protein kinase domain-containing protein [Trichoderma simmonsii]
MGEVQALEALCVAANSIWGDEDETIVYAQVLGQGKAVIFRFQRSHDSLPESLPSRIVCCYHNLEVPDGAFTFQDRSSMRSALWSAIATVWPDCIKDPAIANPGIVVDILPGETQEIIWRAYQEPLFDQYLALLRDIQPSNLVAEGHFSRILDISEIVLLEALGGRGCSKRVQVQDSGKLSTLVFQGVDFQTYLYLHDNGDELARTMVDVWRRSTRLIANMPRHPNIQSPPRYLVSVRDSMLNIVLIGHLSTYFAVGDLGNAIEAANTSESQIPLKQKAKWFHQMCLAITHTHRVAHTFHMDIKPGNFVIDDQENLILIDWEQSGAPATTLAPEADGTWDVEEQDMNENGSPKLVYTKYTGPERRNMPEGSGRESFSIWNVFPEWQASCPRAVELAEVFALGRTMWMLLSQTANNFDEVEHPNDVQVTWTVKTILHPIGSKSWKIA